MIFGKSCSQRYGERQDRLSKLREPREWFAWFPVIESSGRWVWLQKVWLTHRIYKTDGYLWRGGIFPRIDVNKPRGN